MDIQYKSVKISSHAKNNNTKKAQKAAVIVPLCLSGVFCISELVVPIAKIVQQGGISFFLQYLSYNSFLKVIYIFINYFAPTLISTIIFMFIQQFVLGIPAGLDRQRVVSLSIVTLLYLILYIMYIITQTSLDLIGWLLFAFTCIAIPTLWLSLRKDIRQSGNRNGVFSGQGNRSTSNKQQNLKRK